MEHRRWLPGGARWLLLLAVLVFATGCGEESAGDPVGVDAWLPLTVGDREIQIQLALSGPEQQRGLMHREDLPDDGGMLFLFETPRRAAFWMKNTPLPLDIGYFDASGRLLEVREMYPFRESSVVSASDEVVAALEMERGAFARLGIAPGDTIDRGSLVRALERRGATGDPYPFP